MYLPLAGPQGRLGETSDAEIASALPRSARTASPAKCRGEIIGIIESLRGTDYTSRPIGGRSHTQTTQDRPMGLLPNLKGEIQRGGGARLCQPSAEERGSQSRSGVVCACRRNDGQKQEGCGRSKKRAGMRDRLTEGTGRCVVLDRRFVLRGRGRQHVADRRAGHRLRCPMDMGLGDEGLKRKGEQQHPGDGTPAQIPAPNFGEFRSLLSSYNPQSVASDGKSIAAIVKNRHGPPEWARDRFRQNMGIA